MTPQHRRQRAVEEYADIVYGPRSRAAHILPHLPAGHPDRLSIALCGMWMTLRSDWRGLGSYREWERGRALPLCKSCRKIAIESGWMKEGDE